MVPCDTNFQSYDSLRNSLKTMRLSWLLQPKGLTTPAIDETVNRECDVDQVF